MIGNLLLRGMIAGVLAALLTFGFAQAFGEPQIEAAVALEGQAESGPEAVTAHDHGPQGHGGDHGAGGHDHGADAGISRATQAGLGLLTGLVVFGAAVGGVFAAAFALLHGRMGPARPWALSMLLALAGFAVLGLIPGLKYPANPPAVGSGDTIGLRTVLFFAMIAASFASAMAALYAGRALAPGLGRGRATIAGLALFAALTGLAHAAMPSFNEVPPDFPADLLWRFRLASLGTQAVLWAGIGAIFGLAAERALRRDARPALG